MKTILNSLLFLLISVTPSKCANNLFEQLQGKWMSIDDMDCPDVILFHKSGRYVILNDCGSTHPWVPIVERGSWEIKNKNKIFLKSREFVIGNTELGGNNAEFRIYHGADSILMLEIGNISKQHLTLDFYKDGEKYRDDYKRIKLPSKMMCRYIGFKSEAKRLKLPSSGGRTLLKLNYKLFHSGVHDSNPSELIVEDQAGHELWRKTVVFKQKKEIEEILLADKQEVINLNTLIFKVKTKDDVYWELKAKLY